MMGAAPLDDPTCHTCASFEPGRARCALHGRPVDPALHLCRDHSSGLYPHLPPGRLFRREETLFGVDLLPERVRFTRPAVPRPFFCARCRSLKEPPPDPAGALLHAALRTASGPPDLALLAAAHLDATAAALGLTGDPADRLAALLAAPPAGLRLALCPRCREKFERRLAAAPPDSPGTRLARLAL